MLAVIHAPIFAETYAARRGAGATLNDRPMRVAETTELSQALLATGFSYGRSELEEGALGDFANLLQKAREIRRGGSAALDLSYTAAGIFAGFWESNLHPHDVAAGALLIREAGGVVTDMKGGDGFLFGRSIVAGDPPIHARLLEELEARRAQSSESEYEA